MPLTSDPDRQNPNDSGLTRRELLQAGAVTGAVAGIVAGSSPALAQDARHEGGHAEHMNTAEPLALQLARIFERVRYDALPPTAIKHAKMILASTLASAAPGTLIESARIVRDLEKEQGGKAEATVWYDGAKLPLSSAARVNAMFSDAAASDDSDLRNIAHTGTSLTALGLAIGEQTGASGRDVLAAMVAGYESAGRFGDVIRGGRPGLHASMVVAFGGVVAASKLLGLTAEQMAHAISMTSVTMGGLQIGTDSWAREYQAGNAALCAINAALAARRGFTVNPDLLEAKGGFIDTYGNPKVDRASLTREPGNPWDIEKFLAIKLVPGAHPLHSSTEAAIAASKQANLAPDDIARVIVSGPSKGSIQYSLKPPTNMPEAIHSFAYFIAAGIVNRDFNWASVTPEKFRDPVAAKLMQRIEFDMNPGSIHYDWNWGGTVTIVAKSGERYAKTVDAPRGSGPSGIDWSDVERKYHALMPDSKLPANRIEAILKQVHDFDRIEHVAPFSRMLV